MDDLLQHTLQRIYRQDVLSFALASGLVALVVCMLDLVGTVLFGRSGLLGVAFGDWRRNLQSILLWGFGAALGAYLGGLVGLFDTSTPIAPVIVGIAWPTILPRLLSMAAKSEPEEEQAAEEDEP